MEINYNKLATFIFSSKNGFKINNIKKELNYNGDDKFIKNILNNLIENGLLLKQGNEYFCK